LKADVSVRSSDEIVAAIRGFTDAQWARLRMVAEKYARKYARLCALEAEELLQEAFCRALAEDRRCPSHVDPVKFLAEVIRSIADGEINKVENQIDVVPVMQPGAVPESAVDPRDSRMSAEQSLIADEDAEAFRQAMLGLFPEDQQARDLIDGILEGCEGEELRALTDLDEIGFASKRRLIRRRIDKHYPKGWKS
jgi:DNA-directed RNA polymerase specialized sigma24 family protein